MKILNGGIVSQRFFISTAKTRPGKMLRGFLLQRLMNSLGGFFAGAHGQDHGSGTGHDVAAGVHAVFGGLHRGFIDNNAAHFWTSRPGVVWRIKGFGVPPISTITVSTGKLKLLPSLTTGRRWPSA